MGQKVIEETITDKEGTFFFKFEWVESPYMLRLHRSGYPYTQFVKGMHGLKDLYILFIEQ